MHRATQQILKLALQSSSLDQAQRTARVDEQVHVAMRPSVAAGDRSKHAHGPCTVPPRDLHDVVAMTTPRFETGRRSDGTGVGIHAAAPLDLSAELTQPA
jgi:hypothetical protein